METVTQNTCLFCGFFVKKSHILLETGYFFVTFDNFPVNKGHSLIMPKRHCSDVFFFNDAEWTDFPLVVKKTKSMLDGEYKPDGYNIGANCGKAAGQTIFHAHVHVIPRYEGDVSDPRGGVRNFKQALVPYDHHTN